jgi:hypothetical protein
MIKMILAMLSWAAMPMVAARSQGGAQVQQMSRNEKAAEPLTAHALVAFFSGSDATKANEKIVQAEMPRLQYLFKMFEASDVQTVKEAVKGLKDHAKAEAGDNTKAPQYRTASTRAGEVQAMYGAWRFGGFKLGEITGGYHYVAEKARETLKEKGIRWTGERVPEAWERDVRKRVDQKANVDLAAEMEREKFKRTHNGEEPTSEQLEEVRQKAADQIQKAGAVQMARRLYEKQGAEFCSWLIESLEACITEGEQQEQESNTGNAQGNRARRVA